MTAYRFFLNRAPVFSYPGGKGEMARLICSLAPWSGNIFAEVFGGRANVFWFAASLGMNYQKFWINDPRMAGFYKSIIQVGAEVVVPYTGRNPDQRKRAYHLYKEAPHSAEAKALESFLCYSGGMYDSVGVRGHLGGPSGEHAGRTLLEANRIMLATKPIITDWDYKRVLACLGPNDFAYLDPPYCGVNAGCYSDLDLDHEELVALLKRAKFRWILSEYRNDLYIRELGEPFLTKRMPNRLRHPRQCRQNPSYREECLWKNF
jgi:site-specific DNA-adenine methylase